MGGPGEENDGSKSDCSIKDGCEYGNRTREKRSVRLLGRDGADGLGRTGVAGALLAVEGSL